MKAGLDVGFGESGPKNKKIGDCRNGKKTPTSGGSWKTLKKIRRLKFD